MKKFKFRLQKVLEYRETIKEEKKRELLIKNQALKAVNQELEELEKAIAQNEIQSGVTVSAQRVYLAGAYGQRLGEEIVQKRLDILEAQRQVEEATVAYIEAAREEKSLSTLKAKRQQEYNEYVQKEDEKFVDELTVQRRARLLISEEKQDGKE